MQLGGDRHKITASIEEYHKCDYNLLCGRLIIELRFRIKPSIWITGRKKRNHSWSKIERIDLMAGFAHTPKFILRLIHLPPQIAYAIGLGPLMGNVVLLLTTIGRKSGKPRVTPLQYEEMDGKIYLGAARGQKADWFRNIQANPHVQVRVQSHKFSGLAEPITDSKQIADFLELRLRRHPKMVGAMLRGEGMRMPPERYDLEKYATQLALVVIKPDSTQG
ncbi:MAG: nitroreductase family deazaflavin-dependent oxidoreductase [Chloroflexi bacterium]|nr:nitroreductase family deazaflavin-dependent oxidoreductase [Chloroflexota bacterium]